MLCSTCKACRKAESRSEVEATLIACYAKESAITRRLDGISTARLATAETAAFVLTAVNERTDKARAL